MSQSFHWNCIFVRTVAMCSWAMLLIQIIYSKIINKHCLVACNVQQQSHVKFTLARYSMKQQYYQQLANAIGNVHRHAFASHLTHLIKTHSDFDCAVIVGCRADSHPVYLFDSLPSHREFLFQQYLLHRLLFHLGCFVQQQTNFLKDLLPIWSLDCHVGFFALRPDNACILSTRATKALRQP